MKLVNELFNDEAGFVVSSELVLIATILVIGMITGLATLRDGVLQELVDLSRAIGAVEQSYTYNSVTAHTSATNGSRYDDFNDFCEPAGEDGAGQEPGCLNLEVTVTASGEGATPVAPAP